MSNETTKYKPQFNGHALRLAMLGATDKQIGYYFKISPETLEEWKNTYPEFFDSIRKLKTAIDMKVVQGLLTSATGEATNKEGITMHNSKVIRTPKAKQYTVDTRAAIFWLLNRQPEAWRGNPTVDTDPEFEVKQVFKIGDQIIEF